MHTVAKVQREKIETAYELLSEDTTTIEKFEKIRILIKGIHPAIDKTLETTSRTITTVQKLHKGEVIELSAEHLPEKTESQKKRKRAMLLFLTSWKNLRSEVKRVKAELNDTSGQTSAHHMTTIGKIARFAKGPLGAVTIAAIAIAGAAILLDRTAVNITITNNGCGPIRPVVQSPIQIPGVKLPSQTIADGQSAVLTVPALMVNVDGTSASTVLISAYGLKMTYTIPDPRTDLIFNGVSLVGKRTTIDLGSQKEHRLILACS